jgi:hypothetical protein
VNGPIRVSLPWLVMAFAAMSCVAPAVTEEDYRDDVSSTASAMASVAESALLTVDVGARGAAPRAYLSLRLTESERDARSITTAFGSVQPPSPALDRLRAAILDRLDLVATLIEELRIAARRGELTRLPEIARPLGRATVELRRIAEQAS